MGALISNRLISEGSTDGITAPADSDELTKLLNQFVIRSTTTTRAGHMRSSAAGGREGTILPRCMVGDLPVVVVVVRRQSNSSRVTKFE